MPPGRQPLQPPRLVLDSPGTPAVLLALSGGQAGREVHAAGRGNFLQENEVVGARSLRELYRKSFRRTESGHGGTRSKACAASCQRTHEGHYLSRLIYADKSLAGLSDRAWTIAHLLAISNALCARLQLRGPHQLLTPIHNNDVPLSAEMSWDRYFDWGDQRRQGGRFDAPLRLMDSDFDTPPKPNQASGCPHSNSTTKSILGPSNAPEAVREDMAAAAASDKPFEWCLDFNIRVFLGFQGFENGFEKDRVVPHEWCGMSSAWLAGSEDVETNQMNEFTLGPSPLVRRVASRVSQSLGLVLPNVSPAGSEPEESAPKKATKPEKAAKPSRSGTCLPICYTQKDKAWSVKCGWAERCKDCDECTGPPSEEWTSALRAAPRKASARATPRDASAPAANVTRAWKLPWDAPDAPERTMPWESAPADEEQRGEQRQQQSEEEAELKIDPYEEEEQLQQQQQAQQQQQET